MPPAVFVKHQLVTPETVDHIYPNDRLMQTPAGSQYLVGARSDVPCSLRLAAAVARSVYRRNASGSPPSTGMTWPVVFALWSPASQQIALALSIGRIGRRVIVRCA